MASGVAGPHPPGLPATETSPGYGQAGHRDSEGPQTRVAGGQAGDRFIRNGRSASGNDGRGRAPPVRLTVTHRGRLREEGPACSGDRPPAQRRPYRAAEPRACSLDAFGRRRGLASCSLGEGPSRGKDQARSPRPRWSASVRACGEARFRTFQNAISCSRKEENFPSMVGTLRENPNIAELASSLNCLPTMRCYIFLSSFFWQGENWEKHVLTKSTLENTIERQLISQQNL